MTLTCPGVNCPLCMADACAACGSAYAGRCDHDLIARHRGRPAYEEPASQRAPTRELPPIDVAETLELDFTDPDATAKVLEFAARLLRARGRIKITVS
jgi:hypothetical protein